MFQSTCLSWAICIPMPLQPTQTVLPEECKGLSSMLGCQHVMPWGSNSTTRLSSLPFYPTHEWWAVECVKWTIKTKCRSCASVLYTLHWGPLPVTLPLPLPLPVTPPLPLPVSLAIALPLPVALPFFIIFLFLSIIISHQILPLPVTLPLPLPLPVTTLIQTLNSHVEKWFLAT